MQMGIKGTGITSRITTIKDCYFRNVVTCAFSAFAAVSAVTTCIQLKDGAAVIAK